MDRNSQANDGAIQGLTETLQFKFQSYFNLIHIYENL